MDFLAENNSCGQTLLQIVSQGNAVLAELSRLSTMIPPQLSQDRYNEILFDFSYFKNIEAFEKRIETDSRLQDLDERFKENHLEILSRFYLVLECVHRYTVQLNRFLEELSDGIYIQQSLESVLHNTDGKQLLAEALYICGVMLLYIDEKLEGGIREKILVLYYRYSAQRSSLDSNVDDVCQLFRSTGYVARRTRPANYPEEYLKRTSINPGFTSLLLGRLRSDDIYNQISLFPLPEHRSVALANQAAIIYITLFFSPKILHSEAAIMREIVDKYFADNWVVATYMGNVVNLIETWEPYRAARQALQNVQEIRDVTTKCEEFHTKVESLMPQMEHILKEGVLTEDSVLESIPKLMAAVRECNVTLRWLLLHTSTNPELTTKRAKQIRDIALQRHDPVKLFKLLLYTAEFELKLKDLFQELLKQKEGKWEKLKTESSERLTELSQVYSGTTPLTRVQKNVKLQKWFDDISKQVSALTYENPLAAGRKIVQLINALKEVQNFHEIEGNINVRQFLQETVKFLHSMLQIINIKDEVLVQLEVVSDISYAWQLIDGYTRHMQKGIKHNPSMVVKLRATFLKLASALDLPLMRINQARSQDMESVSQYYSNELVSYIRKVLHIIPETMFNLLAKIIELQTNRIKQLPTRLMKDQLKQYAQLEERFEVAKLSHDISVFTDGVLEMKTTLVGIVEIDPRQLLEDGIRKELVNQLSFSLHNGLTFSQKPRPGELLEKLTALTNVVDGYYRSFEYVQDYIGIRGLKMFQEEFSRIINYNVEQECNVYLRQYIHDWESEYQSRDIPIPRHPPTDGVSANFIGRLANEWLRITDPKATVYVDSLCTWYDRLTHNKAVILSDFSVMLKAIGAVGMVGLDRLFAFRIAKDIKDMTDSFAKNLDEPVWVESLNSLERTFYKTPADSIGRVCSPLVARISRLYPNLVNILMRIGQTVLLRRLIAHELNKNSKFNGKHLSAALSTFNEALMLNLPPKTKQNDNELLERVANYLRYCGLYDAGQQVYTVLKPVHNLSLFLSLFTVSQMNKFAYSRFVGCLVAKAKQPVDCVPFTYGLFVVLRQYHVDYTESYVEYLCHYLKLNCIMSLTNGKMDNQDLANLLTFLDYSSTELECVDKELVRKFVPDFILTQFKNVVLL